MGDSLVNGIFALAGVAIGGLVTFGGQYYFRAKELRERKQSLAYSVAAEIEAYLDLMERRDHVTYAQQIIDNNRNGVRQLPKAWISGFEKGVETFPILKSVLPEIGLLGDASSIVSKFYSQAMAVRITLMSVDDGDYEQADAKDLAYIFDQELGLWKDTVRVGREAIIKLPAAV